MDYRKLLKLYIDHVLLEEGDDFVYDDGWPRPQPHYFTDEQWAELLKIIEEES